MLESTVQRKNYYRALTRNLVLAVVLVSLLPLFLAGAAVLNLFETDYLNKVEEHLDALVSRQRRTIDAYLSDRLANIRVLARTCSVAELSDPSFLRQKLNLLSEEYQGVYVDLGLVNPDGVQTAYAGPFNLTGAGYAGAAWFQKARQGGQFISDVFTGLRGSPHFIVAAAMSHKGRDWLLKATINFENFNSLVENIKLGRTGFVFILNRRGEFQTMPRQEADPAGGAWRDILSRPLAGERVSITQRTGGQGRGIILASAPLRNVGWIICAQQERSDALARLVQTRDTALVIFLFGAAVILILSLMLARRLVRRIARADLLRERMNDQMIEAGRMATVGELVAGIAHEINNPVAIMMGEVGWIKDLMAEGGPLTDETLHELRQSALQMQKQGERCKHITHTLLGFARKIGAPVEEVNVNALVGEVIGLIEQKPRYALADIETELGANLPFVAVSPGELQQVLLNLINNAVDALGGQGGSVRIITSRQGGMVRLTVTDNGIGIAQANLSRIFDPFYTTKPVGQGTGLGLSICYGIINKLGGEIKVASARNKGSAFTVLLPAHVDAKPAPGILREAVSVQPV